MALFSKIIRFIYRNRSLRFTKEGLSFVLFTLAVGIAAVNTGNNLLYLILAMMLSLIIVSGILSEQCLKHLSVARRFPNHFFAGAPGTLQVRVTNHHRLFPSFSLQVEEQNEMAQLCGDIYLFKLPAGTSQVRNYSITPARRGRYIFQKVAFSTRFPFGLFQKSLIRLFPSEALVYPAIHSVQTLIQEGLLTIGAAREWNRRGPGTALYNLRDYQEGDDARSIHWKTSARQDRLFSKEHQREEEKRVRLILDQKLPAVAQNEGPSDDLRQDFEYAVSLTASLAAYFLDKGYWVELQTESYTIPFGIGPSHLDRILRPLALIRPQILPPEAGLPSDGWQAVSSMIPSPDRPHGRSAGRRASDTSLLIQAWENPVRQQEAGTFLEVLTIPKIKSVWPGPPRERQKRHL